MKEETEAPPHVSAGGTTEIRLRSQLFPFQRPQVEPSSHPQRRQTLDRDVNWRGWMCQRAAAACRATAALSVINARAMKSRSDSLPFTHDADPIFNFFRFETFLQLIERKKQFFRLVFFSLLTPAGTKDGKSQNVFFSLSFNPPVTFSTARRCASTGWRTSFGPSKETFCTRRALSTSGRSLQARCPTLDLER